MKQEFQSLHFTLNVLRSDGWLHKDHNVCTDYWRVSISYSTHVGETMTVFVVKGNNFNLHSGIALALLGHLSLHINSIYSKDLNTKSPLLCQG